LALFRYQPGKGLQQQGPGLHPLQADLARALAGTQDHRVAVLQTGIAWNRELLSADLQQVLSRIPGRGDAGGEQPVGRLLKHSRQYRLAQLDLQGLMLLDAQPGLRPRAVDARLDHVAGLQSRSPARKGGRALFAAQGAEGGFEQDALTFGANDLGTKAALLLQALQQALAAPDRSFEQQAFRCGQVNRAVRDLHRARLLRRWEGSCRIVAGATRVAAARRCVIFTVSAAGAAF